MIMQFWLPAILLLIIATAIFLMPFLSIKNAVKTNANDKRNQLNRALYDVRMAELERDELQGVLVDKNKMIVELQYNLLDDINDVNVVPIEHKNKLLWLPGALLLIFGSISLYWFVGAYPEVNSWQNTLQRYPALHSELLNDPNAQLSEQDLRDIMLGLRTHLASEPSDADGWLLYSRLGIVFKDSELALDAVKKAYLLNPDSIEIVLIYAQLNMQKGVEYTQQVQSMLKKLLIKNPQELKIWSMYTFVALENQDYELAIRCWEKMLTFDNISVKQANMLRDSIRYTKIKQQMKSEEALTQGALTMQSTSQSSTEMDVSTPLYTVNVTVADHVLIPDSGFVIVYAQQVSGSKIPLAAVKLTLNEFPLSTEISDANAMIQGMKLSDQEEFVIKVRLSKHGDVMKKKGDWQGVSKVIKAGHLLPINIVITEKL